ncbi:hypothetical protein EKN38_13030 [Enterobacter sp. WCHEn045836]|uniref:hypothetical protein n=1 Tax=Enterobacter sp. WCHEn045836 TaxID=2497434 RepID=UPI000F84841F|nr:hypothetical protein [Enterobacter sp. WCHEn045836]RTQ01293.1 hypothetical protein EKN38_13030 [Enterobacter sp. WCHEn045836]
MQTLINWTKSPIVVVDDGGRRITLQPGQGKPVAGDFSDHPWVKNNRLEVAEAKVASAHTGEADEELETLRQQFENIFGKPPHKNAGKAKLRQEIEKWRDGAD